MDDSWGSDMARWIQFHRRALVGASGALAVAGFVAMSEIDRIVSGVVVGGSSYSTAALSGR
jgi:hypothetical protein